MSEPPANAWRAAGVSRPALAPRGKRSRIGASTGRLTPAARRLRAGASTGRLRPAAHRADAPIALPARVVPVLRWRQGIATEGGRPMSRTIAPLVALTFLTPALTAPREKDP